MAKKIDSLQYISQETTQLTHLQAIEKACKAGVKWVQLRVKDQPKEIILATAKKAKEITDQHNALLIINDHPDIAAEVDAAGVHVGLGDTAISAARKLLGNDKIIGGTANTIDDIKYHYQQGADYVGVGPFRHTETKKKLSPLLGLDGYKALIDACTTEQIVLPIIAIGGITVADVSSLSAIGVHGVAISGAITRAETPEAMVQAFYEPFLIQN